AVAITQGGPGAVFWMWASATVGMATRFFTCTLACMYRLKDENGVDQGGPMYFIEAGLGRRFRILAILFSVCGLVGCLSLFQANQLAEVLEGSYGLSRGWTGIICMLTVGAVVIGGIQRIGRVTSRVVPLMCGLYIMACLYVLATHLSEIPKLFLRIFHDAFSGTAAMGGTAGITFSTVVSTGVKRASFSNEAGIGTAALAHGAARTGQPIREGLVAMNGPFIDTIVVCTMTALVVLAEGNWQAGNVQGVDLTVQAFRSAMGDLGQLLIVLSVTLFAVSTMVGYSYYARKCFSYLVGWRRGVFYNYFYCAMILVGALWSTESVVNLLDTSFALMAVPTISATLMLSPRVMKAARDYFRNVKTSTADFAKINS
ncbi:MAG: amino acid carrier protein, partial [Deltaproteobacteria bacterium]|nr:amino acid carrier protein [Deltaproteobacteria bacterium]